MHSRFAPRRALQALENLLADPDDLPQVFTLVQALSGRSPQRMLRRMRKSESGARLLATKPEIVPILSNRDGLRALPDGSLGRAYLAFLESEQISAAGIIDASEKGREKENDTDPDLVWLQRRMRDTHDLWHAVFGYRGDVLGEAALLGVILAQTHNPGIGLLVAAALAKTIAQAAGRRLILDGIGRGRRAAWLPAVAWEDLLALPVEEVRARLHVGAPPSYVPVRSSEIRAARAAA